MGRRQTLGGVRSDGARVERVGAGAIHAAQEKDLARRMIDDPEALRLLPRQVQTVQVASGRIGQYSPSWCQGVRLPLKPGLAKKLVFQSAMSDPISCETMSRIRGSSQ